MRDRDHRPSHDYVLLECLFSNPFRRQQRLLVSDISISILASFFPLDCNSVAGLSWKLNFSPLLCSVLLLHILCIHSTVVAKPYPEISSPQLACSWPRLSSFAVSPPLGFASLPLPFSKLSWSLTFVLSLLVPPPPPKLAATVRPFLRFFDFHFPPSSRRLLPLYHSIAALRLSLAASFDPHSLLRFLASNHTLHEQQQQQASPPAASPL